MLKFKNVFSGHYVALSVIVLLLTLNVFYVDALENNIWNDNVAYYEFNNNLNDFCGNYDLSANDTTFYGNGIQNQAVNFSNRNFALSKCNLENVLNVSGSWNYNQTITGWINVNNAMANSPNGFISIDNSTFSSVDMAIVWDESRLKGFYAPSNYLRPTPSLDYYNVWYFYVLTMEDEGANVRFKLYSSMTSMSTPQKNIAFTKSSLNDMKNLCLKINFMGWLTGTAPNVQRLNNASYDNVGFWNRTLNNTEMQDLYNLGSGIDRNGSIPANVSILSPNNITNYTNSVFINYSASNSSDCSGLDHYYIGLYDDSGTFLEDIILNNGLNLNYTYDSSNLSNGAYKIYVTVIKTDLSNITAYQSFNIYNAPVIPPVIEQKVSTSSSSSGISIFEINKGSEIMSSSFQDVFQMDYITEKCSCVDLDNNFTGINHFPVLYADLYCYNNNTCISGNGSFIESDPFYYLNPSGYYNITTLPSFTELDPYYFSNPSGYYNSTTIPSFTDTNDSLRVDAINSTIINSNASWLKDTNDSLRVDAINTTIINSNASWLKDTNDSLRVDAINSTIINSNASWLKDTNDTLRVDALNLSKSGVGSCPDGYVIQNLTNNTPQCVIKIDPSITYYPNVTLTTGGTNTTANITLLWYYDGSSYNITEGSGANSLNFYINYTNVTTFNQIILREYYLESSSHNIQIDLYDYNTLSWQSYYTFSGQTGYNIITIPVLDPTEHINISNGGIAQLRLSHIENGISSHRLYIDLAILLSGNNIGASTSLIDFVKIGQSNKTKSYCGNITGSNVDLCNITTTGGGVSIDQNVNISANVTFNSVRNSKNVSYYSMAQTDDFSGLNHDLTDVNGYSNVSGILNDSVFLNRSLSQYLVNDAGIDNSFMSSGFTAGAWIKMRSTDSQQRFIGMLVPALADFGLMTDITAFGCTVNKASVHYYYGSGYHEACGTTNIKDGNWHFIVGVYNGTNLSIFVDGTREHIISATNPPNDVGTAVVISIGNYYGGADYFNGTIDEVFMSSLPYTQSMITYLYNSGSGRELSYSYDNNLKYLYHLNSMTSLIAVYDEPFPVDFPTNITAPNVCYSDGSQCSLSGFDQNLNTGDHPTFYGLDLYEDGLTIYNGGGISVNDGGGISADGDINANGKMYSGGGYDPPYISLSKQTNTQILDRLQYELPLTSDGDLNLYWNGSILYGGIRRGSDFDVYEIPLKKLGTLKMPNKYDVSYKTIYYFDQMTGKIKERQIAKPINYKLKDGYKVNESTGEIYQIYNKNFIIKSSLAQAITTR